MTLPWVRAAQADIGVTETKGSQHNPRILEHARTAGVTWIRDDETPWCATSCNCWLVEGGCKSTKSAAARSFLRYGTRLSRPVPGAVFVQPRGSDPAKGHTGIVESVSKDGRTFTAINGNTGDMVKRSVYSTSSVLPDGFRWPEGAEMTPEAEAAATGRAPARMLGDRLLRRGDVGPDVEEAQVILHAKGYMAKNNPEISSFGPDTEDAVRKLQRDAGIVIDGVIGPATVAVMTRAMQGMERKEVAKKAAAPVAASGLAAGGALMAGTEVLRQAQTFNDGTIIGLVFMLLILGAGAYALWRWGLNRAERAE